MSHVTGKITLTIVLKSVPGLPIRDCARDYNNCVHARAHLSTIYVTKMTFLSVHII